MIIAFWCVLFAGVLPLACSYLAKGLPKEQGPAGAVARYDNRDPRAWLAQQTGRRARANAAQANSWEAFPFFAAGVVIAVLQHVPVATIDLLAIVFILARMTYIGCYVADLASIRSLVWAIGFGASVALYLFAATGSLR